MEPMTQRKRRMSSIILNYYDFFFTWDIQSNRRRGHTQHIIISEKRRELGLIHIEDQGGLVLRDNKKTYQEK